MQNLSKLSERLADLMNEGGYTQTSLAQAMGTARPKIGLYLQGKRFPDYPNFIALIEFFGCSADYLLGLSEDPAQVSYKPVLPFKDRLRSVLQEKGLSLYAFQKGTNISWGVLGKWLKGQSLPSPYSLAKTARFLDLTVDYILGRTL